MEKDFCRYPPQLEYLKFKENPHLDVYDLVIQYNLNGSNPDGSFTLDDSNFSALKIPSNSSRKQIHCSAIITRSSGAMNTDRDICGPA